MVAAEGFLAAVRGYERARSVCSAECARSVCSADGDIGTLLGAAGLIGGGMLGAGLENCSSGGDMCGFGGFIIGGFIGEAIALPLGVHLAGGRRGWLGAEIGTAFGISALGIAAAFATRGYGLALVVPVQLWSSIAKEQRGAHRGRKATPLEEVRR